MHPLRLEVVLPLLLAGCGRKEAAVLAGGGAPPPALATFSVPVDPARTLEGFAWEGEAFIPALGAETLAFGEVGRTPSTRLYLRGEDLAAELHQQPGWSIEAGPGPGRAQGRPGMGIALELDGRLVLSLLQPLPPSQEGWSIELWLRPRAAQAGVILSLVDLFDVVSEADGRVAAVVNVETPEGPRKVMAKSPGSLVPGEWNHLGVVLDTGIIRHLRVVLNGQVRSERLEGQAPSTFQRLSLGAPSAARQTLPAVMDEVRLQARVANSAEFEAHWRAAPAPLQRLTLAYADGREVHELWTRALEVPRLEPGADWSVGALEHVRADESGLSWVPADWQRIPAVDPPLARTTAPVVEVGGETLFLFSGEVRDSHYGRMLNTSDTWLYDMRAGSWELLDTPVAPPGRCHQPAAYSPEHDVVLMIGGWINETNPGQLLSDLWLFHVKERRWEERKPKGLPGALSDCVVVYHPGRKVFVILAGDWIYTYDPGADVFKAVGKMRLQGSTGGRAKLAIGPIAALDPRTNLVWLFGGADKSEGGEEFSEDFASFDLETGIVTFHEGPRPSARVRGAFAWDPDQQHFTLFGGVREQASQRFDDLWTFKPDELRWEQQPYSGSVTRRGGYYGMGYSREQRRFHLLAGRHSKDRFLEESWALAFDPRAPGRARYLFDREAFPGEAVWFLESEPGEGRVEPRFRASEDARSFGPSLAECPPKGRYVEVDLRFTPGPSGAAPRVRALGFRAPE